jgi:hypothetical protein
VPAYLLLPLLCAAPVPAHLAPPAPPGASAVLPNNPTVPGFRWWYGECELEVVGTVPSAGGPPDVIYRCVSHPDRTWCGGCGGGLSRQTLAQTWAEAGEYPPRPRIESGTYRPFSLTWGEP